MINNFNIDVNNFGIIKNSNVDLKHLTIFNGPNSSGKSFIARLIHLFNSVDVDDLHNDISHSFNNPLKYFNEEDKKIFNDLTVEIGDHFKKCFSNEIIPFKIPKYKFDRLIKEGILKYFSLVFQDFIQKQFNENLDNLINFDESYFEIKFKNLTLYKKKNEPLKFQIDNMEFHGFNDETIKVYATDNAVYINVKPNHVSFNDFYSIFPMIYVNIAHNIANNFFIGNSYYIPAERSEIILDKKTLSRRVKNEAELSKNQSDVLSNIINIDKSNKGEYYELGCKFDSEFSGISVDINEDNFINEIEYKQIESGDVVSSHLLSISIHEMALFSLYLKYVLKRGDLLIIEEPEAHLHPENQILLIKYIVKAVNQGLNVILTSHSEYISDQVNNFVRLSNVSKEKLIQLNFNEDEKLNYDDLNIYSFKKISKNAFCCKKIDIDSTGFFEDNFSKTVDKLYEESINITNAHNR